MTGRSARTNHRQIENAFLLLLPSHFLSFLLHAIYAPLGQLIGSTQAAPARPDHHHFLLLLASSSSSSHSHGTSSITAAAAAAGVFQAG